MAQYDEAAVRTTLTAKRDQLQRDIANITGGDEDPFSTDPQDNAEDDLRGDDADQAEPLTTNENNQQLLPDLRSLLADVNGALQRLDAGTYGTCLVCGKDIDPRRLAAIPWAKYDAEHQDLIDRGLAKDVG